MERCELFSGVTRIRLSPEEAAGFTRIDFSDDNGSFLAQTGFECAERPVYRLESAEGTGEIRQTENGEVVSFEDGEARLIRRSHSTVLHFSCPEEGILTGLGQHEEGLFNYAHKEERLYHHNMKIPVPFLLSSAGWGLLLENGCAMRYRGKGKQFSFALDAAGEISYAVIRGKNCAEVLKKLGTLAGKPVLLPKWAFGYIQSKERYRTAAELTETAKEFRRRHLGLDCIVLDWCSWREGCWGDKTPDPERFPDVPGMIDALHGMDVHFMVSVWPNTSSGRDCDEFAAAGKFLPGSRIYNAFDPEARDLYWKQCRRFWTDGGTDALWCDSDEPITDPDWCGEEKRDEDERMRLITEASALRMDPETMNNYAAEHLRGLYDHWRRDYPGKRPLILSRSGGLDSGALGTILWSGDVAARWDVLRKQVTEAIRTASSGICWWTLDIGAFFVGRKEPWFCSGDYPDGVKDPAYRELYIRWFQFGAMLPVFRSHGTDTPREPWQFGDEDSPEYACIRDTIALRYRLMPYLYATAAQACREGLPMIRAMMTAFPECPELYGVDDQYMLGDALLVKPVTCAIREGGDQVKVQLPPGGWYEWFTGAYFPGGGTVRMEMPLDRFSLFVRAGSILPVAEKAECAAQLSVPARELLVFGGADGSFDLYDDAGDGYETGITIPLQYKEAAGTLTLKRMTGEMPGAAEMTVRFRSPSGVRKDRVIYYAGEEVCVAFDNL